MAINNNKTGDLGFNPTLWATADKLSGNLDTAAYKDVIMGLILVKYISEAFEKTREQLMFDSCCGSGGAFAQSGAVVKERGGRARRQDVRWTFELPTVKTPHDAEVYYRGQ
jgi:type I restriction-modification system DNA methylase subunit